MASTTGSAGADASADVIREVWRPGAAEPVTVHVRPELFSRLLEGRLRGPAPAVRAPVGRSVPLVVDDGIPPFPGFEVHRAVAREEGPAHRPERHPGVAHDRVDTVLVLDPAGGCRPVGDALDRAGGPR